MKRRQCEEGLGGDGESAPSASALARQAQEPLGSAGVSQHAGRHSERAVRLFGS